MRKAWQVGHRGLIGSSLPVPGWAAGQTVRPWTRLERLFYFDFLYIFFEMNPSETYFQFLPLLNHVSA
jgi:hypothetical protein